VILGAAQSNATAKWHIYSDHSTSALPDLLHDTLRSVTVAALLQLWHALHQQTRAVNHEAVR